MANVKGRNVRVEVAKTFGPPKDVAEVTNASPGVATSASHNLVNDTCGFFKDVTGMAQIEGQACRVKNISANTFDLQGLNTTNFSAFNDGKFVPVTAWETLAECTSYSIPGGAGDKLDSTTLLDIVKKEEQGLLPAQTLSLNVNAQTTPSAAMQIIEAAAQEQGNVLVRITLHDGAVRLAYGEPSMPGEDVQKGSLGTGSLDVAVKGFVLKLAA